MYIGDGRKTLKFAVRISASYLLYAMNKLRLSAYLCTPSGNPKLCFGSVCPFCTIFPKPGGRSHGSLLKRQQAVVLIHHSALRHVKTNTCSSFTCLGLRNALHFYPHIGIKSHVHAAAFTVAHACSLSNAKQALRLVTFGASLTKCVAFLPSYRNKKPRTRRGFL